MSFNLTLLEQLKNQRRALSGDLLVMVQWMIGMTTYLNSMEKETQWVVNHSSHRLNFSTSKWSVVPMTI